MDADANREPLIGVFVAEASEGLTRLDRVLRPADGTVPAPHSLQPHYIIAHTLRGAASLYGFPGVAGLAEILETTLEGSSAVLPEDWPGTAALLQELVALLRAQLDRIERGEAEDQTACERWKARHRQAVLRTGEGDPDRSPAEPFPDRYLLPDLDPEVFSYFSPEAQEYLEAMEGALLRLDKDPADADTIQRLFRTAHTLKGSAYTVGFAAIGDLTHHIEDFMGAIREGRMQMTPGLADLIFRAVDVIRLLLKRDSRSLPQTRREFATAMERLAQAAQPQIATALDGPAAVRQPTSVEPAEIQRSAPPDRPGAEPAGKAGSKEAGEGAVIRVSRERLERLLNLVGELVISRGRLEQRLMALEQLSGQVLAYKHRMLESVRTFQDKHAFTLSDPPPGTDEPGGSWMQVLSDFGDLEFDKYDDFNILARRMTEVSADVGESMAQLNASIRKAREDMGHLQRLTRAMRDEIARARMVPIGTPFTRFRRAVREMARVTGKDVTLVTSGEQTKVDTGVVERLVDPLVHLVRNAVYHGVEAPALRVARGKPATGTVYLHAAHRGNAIVIEVEDDGGGLDLERIKAKAVSLGVLRPELAPGLSDSDAIKLVFLPGFSTAEGVGDQAGRGVGLDVVKRAIEAMNGRIDVETEPGVGTKFTLSLPLTLLISTALLVRVGNQRYAVPLPGIREVVLPASGDIRTIGGRTVLQVGDEAIEVLALAQVLGLESPAPSGPTPVVIVRTMTGALGIAVDELFGRQEIVIKTLGTLKPFRESCFGGATIDPEGHVVLVLDVGRLATWRKALGAEVPEEGLVSLPAEGGDRPDAVPPDLPPPVSRILLVDDSLSVRKFVGRMLEGAGYVVDTAVDGEEGLRKASAVAYRLIITDLEMPKLNGYEVIQALRVRPHTQSTPILVMTTRAGEKHRQTALGMGATAYITKPVEERALILEVERRIGTATAMKI